MLITSCSQGYRFAGVVVDGNGHPIKGAIFAVSPAGLPKPNGFDERSASDADGKFNLIWSPIPGVDYFHFLTRCDGYADDYRIVKADADDIRVVLAKTDNGG